MSHDDARARLIGLLEGSLPHAAEAELQAHLALCADCRLEWETLRNLSEAIARLDPLVILPTAATNHLDESHRWLLADALVHQDHPVDRLDLRHALACGACLSAVARHRAAIRAAAGVSVPEPVAVAALVRATAEHRTVKILLSWAGSMLHIVVPPAMPVSHRLGFSVRGSDWESGSIAAWITDVRRGADRPAVTNHMLGEHRVSLAIGPRTDGPLADLTLTLESPRSDQFRLEVTSKGESARTLTADTRGDFKIGGVVLDGCSLTLHDTASGQLVGVITLVGP